MKFSVSHITTRTVAWLMIGIMTLWITNQTLFTHYHKLPDGTVVSHAHPYNKSADHNPFKTHQHSGISLIILLDGSLLFPWLMVITWALPQLTGQLIRQNRAQRYVPLYIQTASGRAPPVC